MCATPLDGSPVAADHAESFDLSATAVSPALWGFGAAKSQQSSMDREIIETLAASQETFRRLAHASRAAKIALMSLGLAREQVVLYGSLSMGRTESTPDALEASAFASQCGSPHRLREVPGCFITDLSDVDCAALLPDQWQAGALIERFTSAIGIDHTEWHNVHATVVPRFSVTQWTMVSNRGAHLDLSCFTDPVQFAQFNARQNAFREIFWSTRRQLVGRFGDAGGDAFDAYIYLLKAFAALTLRHALTSFQAICLGIFVVHRRMLDKQCRTISAMTMMKRFLIFCRHFFSCEPPEITAPRQWQHWHGTRAIDLGGGGHFIERCSRRARSELYFVDAEVSEGVQEADWMNVLHNVEPHTISMAATGALDRWYSSSKQMKGSWPRLKRDLLPVMKLEPEPFLYGR